MNSNTNFSTLRETFGIIDPKTGYQYSDILNAFLMSVRITQDDKDLGKIFLRDNLAFRLHMDGKVKREIKEKGYCDCIVSFQVRTDIKIALARKIRT